MNLNNDPDRDELHTGHPDEEKQDQGEYSFISETHKKRSVSAQEFMRILFMIAAGAAVFGVVAGIAFRMAGGTIGQSSRTVSIPSDAETVSTGSLSESTDEDASSSETASASVTPEASVSPEATPTPTPTEEELQQESLASYERLNAAMKQIASEADKSHVAVAGITSQTDWLNNTDASSVNGDGLIVADNGVGLLILTDYATIDGAGRIMVSFADGSILEASLQKRDPITNLAVISVPLTSIPAATRAGIQTAVLGNSYGVDTGDSVIAIGSPLGYSGSVAYGEVTSLSKRLSVIDGEFELMTTNIQGSGSGSGFLINTDGEVVGWIAQKYATENSSVVTCIPISQLKKRIEVLSNNAPISYAGISGQSVSAEVSARSGLPEGVYITSVEPESPALEAGLSPGDILKTMDGSDVTSMRVVNDRISSHSPGDVISVTVERMGTDGYKTFEFELTIGEKK